MNKKQILPEWFSGELYEEGGLVRNRFSGDEMELTAGELSMYDFVMGATMMVEMGMHHGSMNTDLKKGLDWFRENNAKAYMVLMN
tara:strand:+ start:1143 stop:1397 length:255 start_codon:yes stop_codon:yes gene_type:complete